MALAQSLRALRQKPFDEIVVGQHESKQVLGLAGHEAKARHLPGAADDGVVVGVDDAHSEPGEAHIFGEAVDDVDEVAVEVLLSFQDLGDADEAWGGENGSGVDLVGDEVEVVRVGETHNAPQGFPVQRGTQWVGRVCQDKALDVNVFTFCIFVCLLECFNADLEVVRGFACDGN